MEDREPGVTILYDIETVATDRARELVGSKVYDVPKTYLPTSEMPATIANIKSEEKRNIKYAEWQVKQRKKIESYVQVQQLKDLEKAALHWWMSKVVSIAWNHVHDETGEVITAGVRTGEDECDVISAFINTAMDSAYRVSRVVGKNAKNFDHPYLIGRLLALDLGIPDFLRARVSAMGDINEIFGSLSAKNCQITSLENYAFGLGIAGKLSTGSGVESMYKAGAFDDIKKYNVRDVEIIAEMWRRFMRPYS